MRKVVNSQAVKIALRTADEANRRRIESWLDRLANWDTDEALRNRSQRLESFPSTYVLKAGGDLWLFFEVGEKTITALDIAKTRSILMSAGIPETE